MTRSRPVIIGRDGQLARALLTAIPGALATSHRGPFSLDLEKLPAGGAEIDGLIKTLNPSAIYCVGALTNVDLCEREARRALRTNALGPARLAAAAARATIPFVYVSSDYVFDGSAGPYDEAASHHPINAYGRSKAFGERAVLAAHAGALVIRTTGIYGPDPRRMNFVYTLRQALADERTLDVPSDQLGSPTYAPDLAQATIALVARGIVGVVHVAGPEWLHRVDFARRIARAFGADETAINPVTTASLDRAATRPLRCGLRTERLRGLVPGVTLRALEPALREWLAHEPGLLIRRKASAVSQHS